MNTEIIENLPLIENNEFLELWETKKKTIESSDFYLSFSKLKKFRVSPLDFVQYLLNADKKTDSMNFGQIDHVLILEGEAVFNRQYIVLDLDTDLRTNESKDGKIGKIEYKEIEAAAQKEGKGIVKKKEIESAKHIRQMLMNDSKCRTLILDSEAEKVIDYTLDYNGNKTRFKGRIDGVGEGFKFDLKNINNYQNKNIRQHIINEGLHIQAAIYQMSNVGHFNDDYYILAANENGVLPVLLKPSMIERGVRDLYKLLDKFELCMLEDRWLESNGFWFKGGVLEID